MCFCVSAPPSASLPHLQVVCHDFRTPCSAGKATDGVVAEPVSSSSRILKANRLRWAAVAVSRAAIPPPVRSVCTPLPALPALHSPHFQTVCRLLKVPWQQPSVPQGKRRPKRLRNWFFHACPRLSLSSQAAIPPLVSSIRALLPTLPHPCSPWTFALKYPVLFSNTPGSHHSAGR